jgi:asparagine synthase (glutamine-hydrolysing)
MCGIVAAFCAHQPVPAEALAAGLRRLLHRGPDEQKSWFAADGRVALAHSRLSIVDLISGGQPLSNEDDTIHVITNGEFYGFEAIRQGLQAQGHRFRSHSDAEILPHLYEELGLECLRRLRGEFAFVLWDERERVFFAARDRFGIKPLYFAAHAGALYVASEVKGLFAAGVPARWDYESVHQQLFACLAGERTLYKGVSQLPPGHYLYADARGMRVVRYWDLDYPRVDSSSPGPCSEAQEIGRFREHLQDAVAVRMRADVPIGCFLSGGIDSSSVLALATQLTGERLRAFTVSYSEPEYDEGPLAAEFARHCGAESDVLSVVDEDYADHIVQALWHAETLAFNLHGVARYLQCRRVRERGFKAVLSGEGADEVLAGYGFWRRDAAEKPIVTRPPVASLRGVHRALGFVPDWLERLAVNRSVLNLFLSPDFADRFAGTDAYVRFIEQFPLTEQLDGRAALAKSLYLWNRSILPNYVLVAERLEMSMAVEVRLPFLDHPLFEYARALPQSLLLRAGLEKFVLREAVRPLLTSDVYCRPKRPFTAPPLATVRGSRLHGMLLDMLASREMAQVPFLAHREIRAFLGKSAGYSGRLQMSEDIVALVALSACVLQSRYGLS